jgi:hypothetical protein
MRGTLHIVPSVELPTLFQATKTRPQRSFLRQAGPMLVQAGLCEEGEEADTLTRLLQQITAILTQRGPCTVAEMGEWIPELREKIGYAADKPYAGTFSLGSRLLPGMCVLGMLVRAGVRGGWRSNLYEYATTAVWLSGVDLESLSIEDAQARLLRSYLSAFGPASFDDAVWWSGLGKRNTRKALAPLADEVTSIEIDGLGGDYLVLTTDLQRLQEVPTKAESCVNLLPSLDHYIMGYRDRRRFLAPAHIEQVFDRAGNAFSTVWVNGRVVGVWRVQDATIELLVWNENEREALAAEAKRLGRFLVGGDVKVVVRPYPAEIRVKNPFTLFQKGA